MSRRGVTFTQQNGKWRATLRGYGRNGYIGEYATFEDAVAARVAAEIALHGAEYTSREIEICGEIARVPLVARGGKLVGHAIIDVADAPLVSGLSWCLGRSGYAVARKDGRIVYLHRLIVPGEGVADHIDGDKLNDRRANLRLCTQRENTRNQRGSRNSKSRFKGVQKTADTRYVARIMVDRRPIHLGSFSDPEAAALAYDQAAAQHFGEFARLNFPSETPGVDVTISEIG